jgi:hypothetical protein
LGLQQASIIDSNDGDLNIFSIVLWVSACKRLNLGEGNGLLSN